MKKFISSAMLILMLGMMTSTTVYAQENSQSEQSDRKAQRDAERARQKSEEKALEMALYTEALNSLKENQFVVEADQVIFKTGEHAYVNSNTNFVLVNLKQGTVQVAFNTTVAGPNGIGGVTVDGSVSNVKMEVNKKGNVYYSFSVQGTGVSAQVFVTMSNGSNEATVNINPNFNSRTLTLRGEVIPLEKSRIFKGRAW